MQPILSRPALVEQVYEQLVAAIAEGRLAAGERLTQEALAERLRVSRQPVSHALALLKTEGLAVEQGCRGLVVAPLDAHYLRSLYEVRAALDGVAARLAAEAVAAGRAPTAALAGLRAILADGTAAAERADRAALIAADAAFHHALNALSGNPVLIETAQRQWAHVRRAMGLVLADGATRERVWQEHAGIFEAVAAGDAPSAEARARAHAERAGREAFERLNATLSAAE